MLVVIGRPLERLKVPTACFTLASALSHDTNERPHFGRENDSSMTWHLSDDHRVLRSLVRPTG